MNPLPRIIRWYQRCWASLNYRYCMSNQYLAKQRGDTIEAVWWSRQAVDWQEQWRTA